MTIKGKVHCFFEQSGTFKNEFIKLGIPAEDYDIQNNFGQTDHVVDLFKHIEDAYDGKPSLFDCIDKNDLIMAFFPCIYFCNISELNQKNGPIGSNKWPLSRLWQWKLLYSRKRQHFYELALKMTAVVECREMRMVVENPWHETNYTNYHWFNRPSIIDRNRSIRGDNFVKPTAYWFIGCTPTHGLSIQKTKKEDIKIIGAGGKYNAHFRRTNKNKALKIAKSSNKSGICSEDRSIINPRYAHNFICDFILGGGQTVVPQQLDMFDIANH